MKTELALVSLLVPVSMAPPSHEAFQLKEVTTFYQLNADLRRERERNSEYHRAIVACVNEVGFTFWVNEKPIHVNCTQQIRKKK